MPLAAPGVVMGTTAAFAPGHLSPPTTTPSHVVTTQSDAPSAEPTEAVGPAEAGETHSAAPTETYSAAPPQASERHSSSSPAARASAGSASSEGSVTPTRSEAADNEGVGASKRGADGSDDPPPAPARVPHVVLARGPRRRIPLAAGASPTSSEPGHSGTIHQPDRQTLTNIDAPGGRAWHKGHVKHVTPKPPRRWFGLGRREPEQPEPTVDLREVERPLADDPESVVARLARLRDAGLITNAEFEKERRSVLHLDDASG